MQKRTFIPCLNKQRKLYNLSIESIIGWFIGLVLGLTQGLLWGIGMGAIGMSLGSWIGKLLYKGKVQRFIYWHFPYTKYWLDRNAPNSSDREEL